MGHVQKSRRGASASRSRPSSPKQGPVASHRLSNAAWARLCRTIRALQVQELRQAEQRA